MIKIDGRAIPAPTDYSVGIQDISKAERNARGDMIIERIATKRKLELAWQFLTKSEMQQVLSAVSPVFFQVEYPDPQTGAMKIGTFYSGDRTAPALDFNNGEMRWKNCGLNVIER